MEKNLGSVSTPHKVLSLLVNPIGCIIETISYPTPVRIIKDSSLQSNLLFCEVQGTK